MSFVMAGLAMGFLGSSHCLGMCGGIAGALAAARPDPGGGAAPRDLARGLLCNTGRIASYAAMGAATGAFGAALAGLGGTTGMFALRALAALLIVATGLYLAGWSSGIARIEAAGGRVWRRVAPLARKARASSSPLAPLAFGALWGWLPCGLVYSALAVAAASGSGAGGALTMAAFGLGTLPATLAIGLFAGRGAAALRTHAARRLAGTMIVGFGLWTFAAAASAWSPHAPASGSCHETVAAAPAD